MCRPYDVPCNIQPKHGISKAGYIPHKKAVYTTSDQWFYKMATTSCDNSLSVKELGINLQFYLFLINSSLMSYHSYCRLLIKNYYFGEIYVKLLIFPFISLHCRMQCNAAMNMMQVSFCSFTSIYLHVTPSMFGCIPNKIGVSMARQDLRFQYAYSKQGKRHCSFRPEEKVMNRHCWRPFLYSSVSTGYVYPRPRNMCIPGPVHISLGVSRVGNCVGIQ